MSQTIHAIYENGVFKPLDPPDLAESERVRLTVDPVKSEQTSPNNGDAVDPLAGVRAATGISDLAEKFDDYRFGKQRP